MQVPVLVQLPVLVQVLVQVLVEVQVQVQVQVQVVVLLQFLREPKASAHHLQLLGGLHHFLYSSAEDALHNKDGQVAVKDTK